MTTLTTSNSGSSACAAWRRAPRKASSSCWNAWSAPHERLHETGAGAPEGEVPEGAEAAQTAGEALAGYAAVLRGQTHPAREGCPRAGAGAMRGTEPVARARVRLEPGGRP